MNLSQDVAMGLQYPDVGVLGKRGMKKGPRAMRRGPSLISWRLQDDPVDVVGGESTEGPSTVGSWGLTRISGCGKLDRMTDQEPSPASRVPIPPKPLSEWLVVITMDRVSLDSGDVLESRPFPFLLPAVSQEVAERAGRLISTAICQGSDYQWRLASYADHRSNPVLVTATDKEGSHA